MLALKFIRENVEAVKRAAAVKGEPLDIDALLAKDEERRKLLGEVEKLRNERNEVSKKVGEMKKAGEDAGEIIAEVGKVGDRIKELDETLRGVEEDLNAALLTVPNIPADDVPEGDETANELIKEVGEKKAFSFQPLPHWELAEKLGILDFGVGSKISGSGFMFFRGAGARLQRALIAFMIDMHTDHHGYTEVYPPFLVNRESMTGTGQLPKLEFDMYRLPEDDLFLIPTAEVPITNIHRDDTLDESELPKYYCGYTACFRREAGAAGKDTRGLLRVHQFDKVEMVKFVAPETSWDELESLLANAEAVVQALGLHYRVVKLAAGDLSFAGAKCYDIEVYAPGVDTYLEISSCSNFTDFQARRCNIAFKKGGKKQGLVHTLNGSGIALPRTVVAILENYQREDGTVEIPEVLRPYMKIDAIEPE
ncbi:serine--tRNA ligase [Planctomycetota bacterium]